MTYFLGASPFSFKDEDTGKMVEGVTVWFCDDTRKGAVGLIPWKASHTNERFKDVYGDLQDYTGYAFCPVEVVCNRFGKPESVHFIEAQD